MRILLGFVLAMSISMLLIPALIRWAGPLRILDLPEARKVHAMPIPRVGGIAMVIGIVVALLAWGGEAPWLPAYVSAMIILAAFGAWDDRMNLPAGTKFMGQLLAVALAVLWGGITVTSVTFSDRVPVWEWVAVPMSLLFLLGGTNAFNLSDGLDGLAGGMATLCLSGTALLAFTVGNTTVGSVAVIMIGSLAGFLRFNTHPARVFMGDAGSQVLGFAAAALAMLLTQDPRTPLSTALPLLLLGMPIIDTVMVMTERVMAGMSPFKADRGHIHHRLLALGFEHWEAVSILYLLQAALFVGAWFLRYDSDLIVASVFVVFAVMVLLPIRAAQHLGYAVRRAPTEGRQGDAANSMRLSLALPCAVATIVLAVAMAGYSAWALLFTTQPSRDVQLLAISAGLVMVVGLILRWKRSEVSWVEKSGLYSCAALAVFMSRQAFPDARHPPLVECILFPLLAVAVAVWIRTSKDRPFRITPLDILVLLVVVTVPNLPGSITSASSMGLAVAELALLLYAVEALSLAARNHWRWLSGCAVMFLFGMAVRSGM